MFFTKQKIRVAAIFFLLNFINHLFAPVYLMALTSGPSSPEFSSFEPVATTNMVDPFSGDFTYNLPVLNIPGPDGAGYAMSLSYHSGVTPEEEASWVGYGWTLSPGALNRNKMGYPDDYNGAEIIEYGKVRPNWSASSLVHGSLELKSQDIETETGNDGSTKTDTSYNTTVSFNLSKSVRMNNYKGFYSSYGFGVGYKGMGSLNMNTGRGGTTFGVTINPMVIYSKSKKKKDKEKKSKKDQSTQYLRTQQNTAINKNFAKNFFKAKLRSVGSYSTNDLSGYSVPFTVGNYTGFSYNRSLTVQPSFFQNIGIQLGASGNFNVQVSPLKKKMKAYGYMHSPKVEEYDQTEGFGSGGGYYGKVLSDFSVEREATFSKRDKFLGVPFATPDQFISTGEHVIGGFRLHHHNIGQFYPSGSKNYMPIRNLGFETAIAVTDGTIGMDLGLGYQWNTVSNWGNGYSYNAPITSDDYPSVQETSLNDINYYSVSFNDILSQPIFKYPSQNSKNDNNEIPLPIYIRLAEGSIDDLPEQFRYKKTVKIKGISHIVATEDDLKPEAGPSKGEKVFKSTRFATQNHPNDLLIVSELDNVEFGDDVTFRFNQDPANEWTYTNFSDYKEPTAASLGVANAYALGARKASPEIGSMGIEQRSNTQELSSKIDFHKYKDFSTGVERFSKNQSIIDFTSNLSSEYNEAITEFSVIGNDGSKTVYGLPVFAKNEASLNIGIDPEEVDENEYLVYKDDLYLGDKTLENEQVSGTFSKTPYSTHHLITEITNINYVDVTGNGPSDDDLGGWTKFDYKKWNDSESEWYNYRIPYKGLHYQKGAYSDQKDDVGSVTRGEKQVYYMKGVETKTHYAFFITNKTKKEDFNDLAFYNQIQDRTLELLEGSKKVRKDSYGAPELEMSGIDPAAREDFDIVDTDKGLEYLEKIVLISKSRPNKPLQVTHFDYDYSLCKGAPNNIDGSGKLTLKKVWFESEGILRNKIAPYKFEYNYPKSNHFVSGGNVLEEYEVLASAFDNTQQENPDYSPFSLDPWGNYRSQGEELAKEHFKWVNQEPKQSFDPAAWNLKKITLPSGGEIIVHYEQKDYAYVQDQKAEVLKPIQIHADSYKDAEYFIDVSEVPENKRTAYADSLRKHFYTSSGPVNYIYFHFLYAVDGGQATLNGDNSEYITGYTTVHNVEYNSQNPDKILIKLGDDDDWDKKNKLAKRDGITYPREVCYDYYISNRDGFFDVAHAQNSEKVKERIDKVDSKFQSMMNEKGNAEGEDIDSEFKSGSRKDVKEAAREAIKYVGNHAFRTVPGKKQVCKSLDAAHSYLRIPVFESKKGGGVRVKRLLMHDKGIESGDDNLYGSEYHYVTESGSTSGVAQNEPMSAKEENPLVKLLDRSNNTVLRKIFVGEERVQMEGPIGSSVMPGPSIGHSRVVIENIHKGKTGTGYQVHEFNTCKEYPFIAKASSFSGNNKKKDWLKLPLGLINIDIKKAWYSQGYTFVRNNMHGKSKKMASYSGNYDFENPKNNADKTPVSYTSYEYFSEGEKIKVLDSFVDEEGVWKLNTVDKLPGLEEDVAAYSKLIKDRILDFNIEFDITVGWAYPVSVTPGFNLFFDYSLKEYGTHVMSKVWNMPCILKKTTAYVQGVKTETENLAFDKYTGKPLVTKTHDGYHNMKLAKSGDYHDGSYYSYNIPAYLIYEGMGLKSLDQENTNQISDVAGQFVSYGKDYEGKAWIDRLNENAVNPNVYQPVGVISASSVVYENNWFLGREGNEVIKDYMKKSSVEGEDPDDEFLLAAKEKLNKIYRPAATYTYKSDVSQANDELSGLVLNSGNINNFKFFNWLTPDLKDENDKYKKYLNSWIIGSEITKYSPNGMPLEETNVLDISSTVRFGYKGNILPVIVAQNAEYGSVFYNDFENESSNDRLVSEAHSGDKALLVSDKSFKIISEKDALFLNQHIKDKGAIVKLWVKSENKRNPLFTIKEGSLFISVVGSSDEFELKQVGAAGEWGLYEAIIDDWSDFEAVGKLNLELQLVYYQQEEEVLYVDDVRFQPFDSEVTCNVYDPASLRLITQFNDQHFGVYYQYNEEGMLVRQSIETERGHKTIQEQQYNILRAESR